MADDKMVQKVNEQPEQARPEQVAQQSRQSQVGVAGQPGQRAAPGRRPLFRSDEIDPSCRWPDHSPSGYLHLYVQKGFTAAKSS